MPATETTDGRFLRLSHWMWRYSLWTVLFFGVPLLALLVYASRS